MIETPEWLATGAIEAEALLLLQPYVELALTTSGGADGMGCPDRGFQ